MASEQCTLYAQLESDFHANERALNTAKELKERGVPNAEVMLAQAQKDFAQADIKFREHPLTCDECKKG